MASRNFIYERRIPFHPQRFHDCLKREWPGVIRSKGVFWLATRLKFAGFWSQAGAISRHECAGNFWAAVPRAQWPEDRAHIERVWKGDNGDCRQEIVLIGQNMDCDALTEMFDHCLLTEEEIATNERRWHKTFADPFPKWKSPVLTLMKCSICSSKNSLSNLSKNIPIMNKQILLRSLTFISFLATASLEAFSEN
jgi:hypothetical protein